MKKLLVLAAAALLAAAPASAQQAAQSPNGDQAVIEQVAAPQENTQQAPSIFVSRQEIQQRVAAMEAERNGESAQMNQSFWYLVAAIALGVLVALLLVD
ncbi:MAG TPA: hypothetical protein VEQ60_10010 [Longimicrobium sp.]|nr:hypothetical protein [Longimicrobium sp.]